MPSTLFRPRPRQQPLFVAALVTVAWAFVLSVYCYAAECLGFHSFLFLDFDAGGGKMSWTKGYQFLMDYSLLVSVLSFGLSLAICRTHYLFAVFGCAVSVTLFVWAAILPRY